MILALAIGIGIPALILGFYFWGRVMYGEKWYIALGKPATGGSNDPLYQENEDDEFTKLNLK
jgi:hypothetical protein